MSYIFQKEHSVDNVDNYAEYDYLTDSQTFFLPAIGELVGRKDLMNVADILREFMIQLMVHEDLHQAIENIGMDTIAEAQHQTIYQTICEFFQKDEQ